MLIRVSGVTLEAVSIILAVFMAGLAIGSIAAGRFVDRLRCPLKWYFIIEFGIAASALVSTLLMKQFPVWMAALAPASQFSTLGISLIRTAISAVTLLIPTILMGATLPLLTRQLASSREEAGQKLSRLYGLNTLGAMLGVLFSGFISIGQFGETNTVIIGIIINILIGFRVYLFVKKLR